MGLALGGTIASIQASGGEGGVEWDIGPWMGVSCGRSKFDTMHFAQLADVVAGALAEALYAPWPPAVAMLVSFSKRAASQSLASVSSRRNATTGISSPARSTAARPAARVMDLLTPIGKGQRGLIVNGARSL